MIITGFIRFLPSSKRHEMKWWDVIQCIYIPDLFPPTNPFPPAKFFINWDVERRSNPFLSVITDTYFFLEGNLFSQVYYRVCSWYKKYFCIIQLLMLLFKLFIIIIWFIVQVLMLLCGLRALVDLRQNRLLEIRRFQIRKKWN